ncbi:MAG: CDP-alcohol phosphatidyltransferase family protein [Faecousia sp.]
MKHESTGKYQKKIFTIPNLLSLFRLCLIPVMVWLYCFRGEYGWTTVTLVLSGVTDIADGIIARKFDMVSDFGKAFDPIADKLTQIAMLFCLVTRFPLMLVPLVILTVKEILAAALNLITAKKTGKVMGAAWHGKLNTVLLYGMMLVHLIWYNIPSGVSTALIVICTCTMLFSSFLYSRRNVDTLKAQKENAASGKD